MDSLSTVSSLEAVIDISANIASLCFQYSVADKNAKTDIEAFSKTINDISNSLQEVKQLLNGQNKSQLSTTYKLSDWLEECYQKLQELKVQLEPGKTLKAMHGVGIQALKWPFTSEQMEKIVDDLRKYAQAFRLALQIDQTGFILSTGKTLNFVKETIDSLFHLLTGDTELRTLYTEALAKYGKEAFSRNHDRLLKRLLKDPRLQSKSKAQLQTIRMLRRRAHRAQVTDLISTTLQPSDSAATQAMERLQDQNLDRRLTLHQPLQKDVLESQASYDREGDNNNEDILVEISEDEDDGSHESSEDGEDDPAPELPSITVGNFDNAFHHHESSKDLDEDKDSSLKIWEAARATSAAPPYFKPITINNERYSDGGTMANNPSHNVITEAAEIGKLDDIGCIVSLGTGSAPELPSITVGNSDNAQDIKEEPDLNSTPTESKVELDLKSAPTEPKSATDIETKMSSSHHSSTRKRKHPSSSKSSKTKQDDWSSITDPEERRRAQKRLAQRKFRDKVRADKERQDREAENQAHAGHAYHTPDPNEIYNDAEASAIPWGSMSMRNMVSRGKTQDNTYAHEARPDDTEDIYKDQAYYEGETVDYEEDQPYYEYGSAAGDDWYSRYPQDRPYYGYPSTAGSSSASGYQAHTSHTSAYYHNKPSATLWESMSMKHVNKEKLEAPILELGDAKTVLEELRKRKKEAEAKVKRLDEMLAQLGDDDSSANISLLKEEDEDSHNDMQYYIFKELNKVRVSITLGASFNDFKANLRLFVHPPTTLQEALAYHSYKFVYKMLVERFDSIAEGEYIWLREWDQMGFSRDEMAEFLLEDVNDSPWIYFEAGDVPRNEMQPGIHMTGCIHQICSSDVAPVDQSQLQPRSSRPGEGGDIKMTVQELCGLAGITPKSRNLDDWTGTVRFQEQNSTAIVSYSIRKDEEAANHHAIARRIINALQNLCAAVGQVQAAGLCCDCFTVLRQPDDHDLGDVKEARLELLRLDVELPGKLLEELKILPHLDQITLLDVLHSEALAMKILGTLTKGLIETPPGKDVEYVLDLCSMSVQFLCLGFLSYSQAHIGALKPFFLDSPQRKILLMGNRWSKNRGYIVAELKDLTCIGRMIQGPTIAFKMIQTDESLNPSENQLKYDLLTTAEDLLDTWGPGNLIIRKDIERNPCGIKIGGGIVYAVDISGRMFHWTQRIELDQIELEGEFPVAFDPCEQIVIGALVEINKNCSIDEMKCWQNSLAFFENLGTYGTCWEPSERQLGLQGGYTYTMLQGNQTWCKIQGKTLKQLHLEQKDRLIPFLESAWGLQVSFCTGVARRIPLRELVADLLPIFAETLLITPNLWKDLSSHHNIIDIFYRGKLRDEINKLAPELQEYILTLVRRVLEILEPTGVDNKGKQLTIAWPCDGDIQRCFKIQCKDQSFWARLLADSEDCATFSYISCKCLESEGVKCRGPDPSPAWQNATTLLETAIIHHQSASTAPPCTLEHNKAYYFKKLDSLFVVRVHRPDALKSARLVASQTTMPQRLQERFRGKRWMMQYRLREIQEAHEPAEQVLVSTL